MLGVRFNLERFMGCIPDNPQDDIAANEEWNIIAFVAWYLGIYQKILNFFRPLHAIRLEPVALLPVTDPERDRF